MPYYKPYRNIFPQPQLAVFFLRLSFWEFMHQTTVSQIKVFYDASDGMLI